MESTGDSNVLFADNEDGLSLNSSGERSEELDSSCEDSYSGLEVAGPYSEEPLADEQWLEVYNRERQMIEERQQELQNRSDRVVELGTWCKCSNCHVELLQNPKECQCCHEIEGCLESLGSELVLREVNSAPNCITNHPGFNPVCLNRWLLRSAAAKYKAQDGARYRQTGTETDFLRATSYREFTQLVHGYLGPRRIPLPACAYHVIRNEFGAEGATFTGYEDDED